MPEGTTGSQSRATKIEHGLSLREAIARVSRRLSEAGINGATRDARHLTTVAAGVRAVDLISNPDAMLDEHAAERLNRWTIRRARREPVSRILGQREFYGRAFEISPATLDPRADTETVINACIEMLNEAGIDKYAPLRILDIGTGSGCLIVTLLAELPAAIGVATDICPSALAVALRNAERLGVAERLTLRRCDLLDGIDGSYNLVVSNPPYIPTADIAGLEREVSVFDPLFALDGGADGLDFYRRIAAGLSRVMAQPPDLSLAAVEIGADQARDVVELLQEAGFPPPRTWLDLGGHTRCVAVQPRR